MAIFRQGVKVGKFDVRTGVTKKRAQGLLRKKGILEDGKGRSEFEKDAGGEVQTIRSVVGKGEGFQIPANFKVNFKMPQCVNQETFPGGGQGPGGASGLWNK